MEEDLATNLPTEIMINILSRLPIGAIMRFKCVSKSWLNFFETREFAKSHHSRSVPGLAVYQGKTSSKPYKFFEFAHHHNAVLNLSFPHHGLRIHSSINGLLFLSDLMISLDNLIICNPITREFIKIPCPQEYSTSNKGNFFGFGESKMTNQYKLVRIFQKCNLDHRELEWDWKDKTKCEVFILGIGRWRSIEPSGPFLYECNTNVGLYLCPIKVFKESDILTAYERVFITKDGHSRLLCYSSKTKTNRRTGGLIELYGYDRSSVVSYTPSLLRLSTFMMQKSHELPDEQVRWELFLRLHSDKNGVFTYKESEHLAEVYRRAASTDEVPKVDMTTIYLDAFGGMNKKKHMFSTRSRSHLYSGDSSGSSMRSEATSQPMFTKEAFTQLVDEMQAQIWDEVRS
ncbi:hypothetical protein C2S51_014938 [Perilla frutescens var. frutescens]|nr:hypothetical protein C2S51_014938 [Perilla frutescens var. frutescens]